MSEEERCERTELLVSACAHCRGMVEEEPNPYEGLLIERFYLSARHQQRCSMSRRGLQDHDIGFGEQFALAVHDNEDGRAVFKRFGYVCAECMDHITNGRGE